MQIKEITQYIANDGTIFDNEDDCLVHEMLPFIDNISIYERDENTGDYIPLEFTLENCATCSLLYVKTTEAAYAFGKFCCEMGFDSPFSDGCKPGIYSYDYDDNQWIDWPKFFNNLADTNDKIATITGTNLVKTPSAAKQYIGIVNDSRSDRTDIICVNHNKDVVLRQLYDCYMQTKKEEKPMASSPKYRFESFAKAAESLSAFLQYDDHHINFELHEIS